MLATMYFNQQSTVNLLRGSKNSLFTNVIKSVLSLLLLVILGTTAHSQTVTIEAKPDVICEGNLTTIIATVSGLPSGVTVKTYEYHFADLAGTVVTQNIASGTNAYAPGSYSPFVVVQLNGAANITSSVLPITIYRRPIPNFINITRDTQCFKGNSVCFQNLSTQPAAPSNPIVTYVWLYGNGFFDSVTTNANQCHNYNAANSYIVTLRAIDDKGCVADTFLIPSKPIVINAPVSPKFTWNQLSGPCFKSTYRFTNTSAVPLSSLHSFTWSFGDGVSYTATSPFSAQAITNYNSITNTYYKNGAFNPGLILESIYGCIDSIRYTDANSTRPLPYNIRFDFDIVTTKSNTSDEARDSVCIGSANGAGICFKQTPISFVSSGTGDFVWNFDDPPTLQKNFDINSWTPCHTFSAMKTYYVTLTINNVCGPIPIKHTFYSSATFSSDRYIDKIIYADNDMLDPVSAPRLVTDTLVSPGSEEPKRKLVYAGSYKLSAGQYIGADTLYAFQDINSARPIYYISTDSLIFDAPGVLKDTVELPFNFVSYKPITGTVPLKYDTFAGYMYYGYGARVIGPKSQIEDKITPVLLAGYQKNQCGPTDTVDFINTSTSYKSRKVFRVWNFDDNFAPQCTSFSVPKSGWPRISFIQKRDSVTYDNGKTFYPFGPDTTRKWTDAVEQYNNSDHYFIIGATTYPGKMNCKFSFDTLPRHFYPNWDSVFRWYAGGKDFMPWDPTKYGNGPGLIPINDADTLYWNKPVYLNPSTGEWSLTPGFGPAPFGAWARIDNLNFKYNNDQDLKVGEPIIVTNLPDPFKQANVRPDGRYPVISSGRVEPGKPIRYSWLGKTITINGSDILPGENVSFYQYAFRRTITRCITVKLNLNDSFNNESLGATDMDSTKLDTLDCKMEGTVQLPFAKADARGLGKRGKECPGGVPNGVFFEFTASGNFPGLLPSCGATFILFNYDSLADRMDGTPCALDGFVTWTGGATPGGLSSPTFFPTQNFMPIPWLDPAGTTIAYHYGLNAPTNRPPPADTAQGWITVGILIGSGCRDTITTNVTMSVYRANQSVYDADISVPVQYPSSSSPVPGAATNYAYKFTQLINYRPFIIGGTVDTLVDIQYQDCKWAKCLSDTVWYHRFLRINNLTAKFEVEPTNCRLRHKGETIKVHYEDSIQDLIKYSVWSWGDQTATVDSFYYIPDSFDVCLDSVITGVLLTDYNANPSNYQSTISYPIPSNMQVQGGGSTYNFEFAGLSNIKTTFNGMGYDTTVDVVLRDCKWSNGYYINGVRRVRYNFDLFNGIITLLDSTVWPERASGIGATDGLKPGILSDTILSDQFYRIYNIISRTDVPGKMIVMDKCSGYIDTIQNADTARYFSIIQIIDSAFAFFPLEHKFIRTSWEVADKLPGSSTGNIIHLIGSKDPYNCTQVFALPVTIGFIDTFDIFNSSGEKDTLFCENEPVYFLDSIRYFRYDCQVTDLPFIPAQSKSAAYIGFLDPPYDNLQIDSADFWRQDFGDPRAIQNIVPFTPFIKWNAAAMKYDIITKIDTVVAERVYWDYGDGSPLDSNLRPVHRYKKYGRYTVNMYSKDSLGFFDTCVAYVNISKPIAKIGFLQNPNGTPKDIFTCGVIAQFLDSTKMAESSTGDPVSDSVRTNYWWFGDNKVDTTMWQSTQNFNPGWNYRTNGLFRLKLVSETYQGCKDTTYDSVFISGPRPYVKLLSNSDTIGCAPFKIKLLNLADSLGGQLDANGHPLIDTPTQTTIVYWGDKNNSRQLVFGRRDTVEFTYDTAGVYFIYVQGSDAAFGGANQCPLVLYPDTPNQTPIRLEVINLLREVLLDKDVVCKGNAVQVQNNSDTRYSQYTYITETKGTAIDSTVKAQQSPYTFTRTFNDTGYYTIIARPDSVTGIPQSAIANCKITDTLNVRVVFPAPSFNVDTAETPKYKLLNTSDTTISDKYDWLVRKDGTSTVMFSYSGDNSNPNFEFDLQNDTGKYVVCLTASAKGIPTAEACVDSVCQFVINSFNVNVEVPNAFSPNNDGLNDLFKIRIEGEEKYKLVVYNRWGAKVFESGTQALMWNGKTNNDGTECPSGVYYYIFDYQLRSQDPKTKTGSITLVR